MSTFVRLLVATLVCCAFSFVGVATVVASFVWPSPEGLDALVSSSSC